MPRPRGLEGLSVLPHTLPTIAYKNQDGGDRSAIVPAEQGTLVEIVSHGLPTRYY